VLNKIKLISLRLFIFQGKVAFSEQGDRIALTQVEQMIDGKYVMLGYYDIENFNFTWHDSEKWIGEFIFCSITLRLSILKPKLCNYRW